MKSKGSTEAKCGYCRYLCTGECPHNVGPHNDIKVYNCTKYKALRVFEDVTDKEDG